MTYYDSLHSLENLQLAFSKARKGKSKKWYVRKFESKLEEELFKLKQELETQTYSPRPLKVFVIRDPKTRVISASNFRDRVVHHAIVNLIEPIFDKAFIYDSYANRKKKGTLGAIKRFDYFKRKVSLNGKLVKNTKDNNMVIGYFLKADIRRYFDSVDHEVLVQILNRKIKDEKFIRLIRIILENNTRKGMPIGNMTSQFFANVYLNELDYFVKHKLKAKYYIRYVDDFVILHKDKNILEQYMDQIAEFLKSLKLELHSQKSKIYPLHKGAKLLGYRVFYHYKLLNKKNFRNFMRKLESSDKEDIAKSLSGWNGYAMWANAYKLKKMLLENTVRY